MKMKLTLVLLLFLGVGVIAKSPKQVEVAANELSERYTRSASGESVEVAAGEPPGKSREGDLEPVTKEGEPLEQPRKGDLKAVSNEGTSSKSAGMNGSGMSGESESENSSETKNKAKSVESGGEDKRRLRGSSEENKGGSKESSQSGGKSKESGADGGQLNGGGTGNQETTSVLHDLASILGLNGIGGISDLVKKYYSGSLSVTLEALLKAIGITTSLQQLQDTSPLLQTMNNIPLLGRIVTFMTNTMSVPINIIAVVFSLVTTMMQHVPKVISSML